MSLTLSYVVIGLSLLVAGYALVLLVRDRLVDNPLFYGSAVLALVLVGQLVGGCVALAQTSRDVEGITFVGYLLTAVLAPPVSIVWGVADKSRWGTGVVVIGMVTVVALQLRLLALWGVGPRGLGGG
jgi:hypothetical protein